MIIVLLNLSILWLMINLDFQFYALDHGLNTILFSKFPQILTFLCASDLEANHNAKYLIPKEG